MDLNHILQIALRYKASDIHIKVGRPPMYRVDGKLHPYSKVPPLTKEQTAGFAALVMTKVQRERFRESLDLDCSYNGGKLGRFRVNVFMQSGYVGMVLRVIPTEIKSLDELLLPPVLKKILKNKRGLILVTGATGSGKSTTLAAMVDHINRTRHEHIMTIEDPIEFIIPDRLCIVNQREVGNDALSFARALKAALRQDPDIILLGELRDIETVEIALTAAETGHLVMGTLHTVDAAESINRVVSLFPTHQHQHIRLQLSSLLKGIVSQRLVRRKNTKGRIAAIEVMVSTTQIKEMIILEDGGRLITDAIAAGHIAYGSQTFDQALMTLLKKGFISYEEALAQSTTPEDFALRVSGIESGGGGGSGDGSGGHLGPKEDEVELELNFS